MLLRELKVIQLLIFMDYCFIILVPEFSSPTRAPVLWKKKEIRPLERRVTTKSRPSLSLRMPYSRFGRGAIPQPQVSQRWPLRQTGRTSLT
jgi:hypothetical protein